MLDDIVVTPSTSYTGTMDGGVTTNYQFGDPSTGLDTGTPDYFSQPTQAGASPSNPNYGTLAQSLLSLGGGLYGLSEGFNLSKMASAAFGASNPFAAYRGQYAQQLSQLMANPSSITSDPGYNESFSEGSQAVTRQMAAGGYNESGNEAIALQKYGQSFASTYLQQKETQLADLAGAGITPNYSASISGASNAASVDSSAINALAYGASGLIGAYTGGTTVAGTPAASKPGGFSAAGGEAAQALAIESNAVGAYKSLGGNTTAINGIQGGISTALAGIGLYEGLQRGGVAGDFQAAAAATKLASTAYTAYEGSSTAAASTGAGQALGVAGEVAGYVGAAYSAYNFVDQEKPGQTGGDTLRGAEAGAAIGTVIVPGIGTVIGGVIGGVVGAVGSLFGHTDTTKRSWQEFTHGQYTDAVAQDPNQLISVLGGLWRSGDGNFPGIKNYSDGNKFSTAMANEISSAMSSGKVAPNADANTIYNSVVQPWLAAMPGGSNWSKSGVQGAEAQVVKDLVGNYVAGKPITDGEIKGGAPNYAYTKYAVTSSNVMNPVVTKPSSKLPAFQQNSAAGIAERNMMNQATTTATSPIVAPTAAGIAQRNTQLLDLRKAS